MNVGILHPGKMGISIAASILNSGHQVYWVSNGRSASSFERANQHKLIDAGSLDNLCSSCPVLISICPPEAAETVARQVMSENYQGIFVEANAISPQRVIKIAEAFTKRESRFVDAGVIGPPAWKPGTTWLHLSGENAKELLELFKSGPINTNVLGADHGMASALKMCFAAYNKGRIAMLMTVLALAEHHEIRDALETQWDNSWPDFVDQTRTTINNALPKAWRFSGEMAEIAATFDAAGLPDGFHKAAEAIYKSLHDYKDSNTTIDTEEILGQILK